MKNGLVFFLPFVLWLAACAAGPDYVRPETAAAKLENYIQAPEDQAPSRTAYWWDTMNDPMMDRYIARLLDQNLDLAQATARVKQAWEARRIEAGALAPSLSAGASANRNFRPSQDVSTIFGGAGGFGAGGVTRIYDTSLEASLSTNWQVDLFGKIRRASRAAEARALAAQADRQALAQALIAELARRRVAISVLQAQIRLARDVVENRQTVLETAQRRYDKGSGSVAATDVHLAQQNLSSAKADIQELFQSITAQSYALDVLMGQRPGATDPLRETISLIVPPRETPAGVPAALLDRRPDIRGAELRLAAGTEDIGVAVANLYPDLTLTGNIGLEDDGVSNILSSDRMIGSLIGDIMVRLFQGGRLRAQIDLEEAQAEDLAAAYAQTVLQALQEVETALSNEKNLATQVAALKTAADSVRKAEQSARGRYERGVAPLTEWLEAERRRYLAEQSLLAARQAQWDARIDLYLALGGDWFAPKKEHNNGNGNKGAGA